MAPVLRQVSPAPKWQGTQRQSSWCTQAGARVPLWLQQLGWGWPHRQRRQRVSQLNQTRRLHAEWQSVVNGPVDCYFISFKERKVDSLTQTLSESLWKLCSYQATRPTDPWKYKKRGGGHVLWQYWWVARRYHRKRKYVLSIPTLFLLQPLKQTDAVRLSPKWDYSSALHSFHTVCRWCIGSGSGLCPIISVMHSCQWWRMPVNCAERCGTSEPLYLFLRVSYK